MVPRVGVEGLDAELSVLDQADSQVLVGQCDVVGEVVDARVGADELPRLGVVVSTLVEQHLVEADGCVLRGVAAGDAHRERRPRHQTATPTHPRHTGPSALPLGPLHSVGPWKSRGPRTPFLPPGTSLPPQAPVPSLPMPTGRTHPALRAWRNKRKISEEKRDMMTSSLGT